MTFNETKGPVFWFLLVVSLIFIYGTVFLAAWNVIQGVI